MSLILLFPLFIFPNNLIYINDGTIATIVRYYISRFSISFLSTIMQNMQLFYSEEGNIKSLQKNRKNCSYRKKLK